MIELLFCIILSMIIQFKLYRDQAHIECYSIVVYLLLGDFSIGYQVKMIYLDIAITIDEQI